MPSTVPSILLHHYPRSPFAEKVRVALGLKGVEWGSVTIPPWMPKPELLPLTGGYRRTPVLQVGADVYCDTREILRQIERMHPAPTLFPDGSEALAMALGWGLEKAVFMAAIGVIVGLTGHTYPRELVEDRLAFFGSSLEQADNLAKQSVYADRLNAQLAGLAGMLADGRPFLLGAAPSAADLCAYHPLWHLRRAGGQDAARAEVVRLLPTLPALFPWLDRVAAIGHGAPRDVPASDALRIAAEAAPMEPGEAPGLSGLLGIQAGDRISVTPDDSGRDPVVGRLLAVSDHAVVIRRTDPALGEVNVHFPRAGFDVAKV